jgi:hypothetical protein
MRSIKVSEFEHRKITAVRKELDQEHQAQVGLKTQLSKGCGPAENIQQSSDLTSRPYAGTFTEASTNKMPTIK